MSAACRICGADRLQRRLPGLLRRCRACGTIQLDIAPVPETYPASYYEGWEIEARAKQALYDRILRWGLSALPAARRLLDIGCALGDSLIVARRHGLEAWGVELDPATARRAAERSSARVLPGGFPHPGLPPDGFDLITAIDVLEHVPTPVDFARAVRRALRPGGAAIFVVPDIASLSARLLGPRWPHIHPEHLNQFTPETLTMALAKAGLALRRRRVSFRALTIRYVRRLLERNPKPGLTPLARAADGLAGPLRDLPLWLATGEMEVLTSPRKTG